MLWAAADVTIPRHETIFWLSRFELAKDFLKCPKSIRGWLPVEGFPDALLFFSRFFAHQSWIQPTRNSRRIAPSTMNPLMLGLL